MESHNFILKWLLQHEDLSERRNLENYQDEGRLAICRVQVFKQVMGMQKDLVSKAVQFFHGKVEDNSSSQVSEIINIMNNKKNMNKMANFSFHTNVCTSFFSLDIYQWIGKEPLEGCFQWWMQILGVCSIRRFLQKILQELTIMVYGISGVILTQNTLQDPPRLHLLMTTTDDYQ